MRVRNIPPRNGEGDRTKCGGGGPASEPAHRRAPSTMLHGHPPKYYFGGNPRMVPLPVPGRN